MAIVARAWPLIVLAVLASACSRRPEQLPPIWTGPTEPYTEVDGGDNAFDSYVRAARLALQADPAGIRRSNFTPGQRRATMSRLAQALDALYEARGRQSRFQFRPQGNPTDYGYVPGWALLGRALGWSIESAVAAQDFPKAISRFLFATKFGLDLGGGGAFEASVGLEIANHARVALLPGLRALSASQLRSLAESLRGLLAKRPPVQGTLERELDSMLSIIQMVQDSFVRGDFSRLDPLGNWVRPDIDYLQRLRDEPIEKQRSFFESLAQEARAITVDAVRMQRKSGPVKVRAVQQNGPGERLAAVVFSNPSRFLRLERKTLARTRLLILHALVLAQLKEQKLVPPSLAGMPRDVIRDPFTGRPFIYRAQGVEYKLYGAGIDGVDNGGETDSYYSSPDLTLEDPSFS